jgi:hypothetical protein
VLDGLGLILSKAWIFLFFFAFMVTVGPTQLSIPVFFKLWSTSFHRPDNERMKIHPYISVQKLPLLVDLQQTVGELVLSITSCPSLIILENTLNYCIEKNVVMVTNHRYNVSPMHLHALLGVGNYTKVVHVHTNRL